MPILHRLRWRITLSYMVVTAIVLVLLEVAFFINLAFNLFAGDYLPILISGEFRNRAGELRLALIEDDPVDDVNAWLNQEAMLRQWRIDDNNAIFIIEFGIDGSALLIFDDDGELLGATPETFQQDTSIKELIQTSLQAQTILYNWSNDYLIIAEPIFGQNGTILGMAGIVIDEPRPWGIFFTAVMTLIVPSVILITLISASLGIGLGYLLTRDLLERFNKIVSASEAWMQGTFSPIDDNSQDELGALIRRLNQMTVKLQAYVDLRENLIRWEERNRLMRDLHDSIKQQAFAASAQLGAATNYISESPEQATIHLEHANTIVDQLRLELGSLIDNLKPPDLVNHTLGQAIAAYAQRWENYLTIELNLQIDETLAMQSDNEVALFRIFQEALANVERHSQANTVKVTLLAQDGLTLIIADDGIGFDKDKIKRGNGLNFIRERALASGMQFDLISSVGRGTTMIIRKEDETWQIVK